MSPPKPLVHFRDIARAFALLTRLPVPGADADRGAASAWAWPLVGGAVGGLAGLGATAALSAGLPPAVAAGLALAVTMIATGALHEDGLADCADGLWGGYDTDRRLAIMKDSAIGSYGVLTLILCVGLQWILLTVLIDLGQLWVAVLAPALASRAAMMAIMAALPFARDDGLARHVGRPDRVTATIGVIIAWILVVLIAPTAAVVLVLAVAATAGAVALLAYRKIGGQTGDVLGATQQLTTIAALAALASVAG